MNTATEPASDGSSANLQVVRAYFNAAAQQDAPALFAILTEDAKIMVPLSLPYGGTYVGTSGFQQAMTGFAAAWRESKTTGLTLVESGDMVIALSRMTAKARDTGHPIDTRVAEVFHLRNGKIASVQPFYQDTALLLRSLAP